MLIGVIGSESFAKFGKYFLVDTGKLLEMGHICQLTCRKFTRRQTIAAEGVDS